MTTITALIVALALPDGSSYETAIPLKSAETCAEAILHVADAIRPDWPDHAVMCRDTGIILSSPIPKPRPANLRRE